jgi:hypothetical protein
MMVWRERRLTYGEVDRRIDALAEYLRTVGCGELVSSHFRGES